MLQVGCKQVHLREIYAVPLRELAVKLGNRVNLLAHVVVGKLRHVLQRS